METTRLTYTVTEAANVLGISRALAYELIARDELPSIRLGRRIVIPAGALHGVLEATRGRPTTPRSRIEPMSSMAITPQSEHGTGETN